MGHRDVEPPVGLAGLVHRDDPGMVEQRGQPGLTQELLAELLVGGELGAQQLERDLPVQARVLGQVHDRVRPLPSSASSR